MAMINAILIAYITAEVYASGFVDAVNDALSKWLRMPILLPKPFGCRECMTFWLCFIAMLIGGYGVLVSAAFALLCRYIGGVLVNVRFTIFEVINQFIIKL